jgi:hypothetical protein
MWNDGESARCLDVGESREVAGEMSAVLFPGPECREPRRDRSGPGRGVARNGARSDTSADSVPTNARAMRFADDPGPPEAAVRRTPAQADAD